MKFMTAKQAAEEWGISVRRARALCSSGKIAGAIKDGKSYRIPVDAEKPADARFRSGNFVMSTPKQYLKWNDDIVGHIGAAGSVSFIAGQY